MEPVKVLLLGAGNRGMYAYAQYAKANPKMMKIVAVAEPDDTKRHTIQADHQIPDDMAFLGWEEALDDKARDKLTGIDAIIITTQDKMHTAPLVKALARNVHVLCEKPVAPTLDECRAIEKAGAGFNKVFQTGYVLRYTTFFSKIKELLNSGAIGTLIGIDHMESVGHIHMSHSFVRGNWRNFAESSPMILAKSCHDMDILYWLAGAPCESLSSYGALNYFTAANAPKGAPHRCLEGCPHMLDCPYHVSKIYLTSNTEWPVNVITTDLSLQGRLAAVEKGPYGRCVFHCDNDVVDYQSAALHFANGVNAVFTMTGFTMKTHRNITLFGAKGEISGDMEDSRIVLHDFSSRHTTTIDLAQPIGGHAGGDTSLITDFVQRIRNNAGKTSTVKDVFESHYMALAAEHSRINGAEKIMLGRWK
ncbi:oxidoreductase [Spirochaetia bacterium]|nr:oxidoreductase [Spirochaetia bacterium]